MTPFSQDKGFHGWPARWRRRGHRSARFCFFPYKHPEAVRLSGAAVNAIGLHGMF